MKRCISILLVLVMIMSLCACCSREIDVKELLTSGNWHQVDNEKVYFSFYKTGTGSYNTGEESGVTALNLTWTELEDNCVRVETSPVLGVSGVWDYEIVYRDDTYYLINVDGKGEEYILK